MMPLNAAMIAAAGDLRAFFLAVEKVDQCPGYAAAFARTVDCVQGTSRRPTCTTWSRKGKKKNLNGAATLACTADGVWSTSRQLSTSKSGSDKGYKLQQVFFFFFFTSSAMVDEDPNPNVLGKWATQAIPMGRSLGLSGGGNTTSRVMENAEELELRPSCHGSGQCPNIHGTDALCHAIGDPNFAP